MERVILHCDANSYYASVECLYTPSICQKPVTVCGEAEARHGIVLTKNQIAKQYGIQTGEAIWQVKQKCPDLICVPSDYALYIRFSEKMRKIYEQYSNRVESFGLDEVWIDVSNPGVNLREGERIAYEIRKSIKRELGITVSVGVFFNKIFAKLGSDMRKPDAVTVIPPDTFREKIWPLPVDALLFVGPATRRKLANMYVYTIGELASFSPELLRYRLGKNGVYLQAYVNGLDRSPVMPVEFHTAIQSVGNSATPRPARHGRRALHLYAARRIRSGAAEGGRSASTLRQHQCAHHGAIHQLPSENPRARYQPDRRNHADGHDTL